MGVTSIFSPITWAKLVFSVFIFTSKILHAELNNLILSVMISQKSYIQKLQNDIEFSQNEFEMR